MRLTSCLCGPQSALWEASSSPGGFSSVPVQSSGVWGLCSDILRPLWTLPLRPLFWRLCLQDLPTIQSIVTLNPGLPWSRSHKTNKITGQQRFQLFSHKNIKDFWVYIKTHESRDWFIQPFIFILFLKMLRQKQGNTLFDSYLSSCETKAWRRSILGIQNVYNEHPQLHTCWHCHGNICCNTLWSHLYSYYFEPRQPHIHTEQLTSALGQRDGGLSTSSPSLSHFHWVGTKWDKQ